MCGQHSSIYDTIALLYKNYTENHRQRQPQLYVCVETDEWWVHSLHVMSHMNIPIALTITMHRHSPRCGKCRRFVRQETETETSYSCACLHQTLKSIFRRETGFHPDITWGFPPICPVSSQKCIKATYRKHCFWLFIVNVCISVCVITSTIQLLPESQYTTEEFAS